MKIYYIEYQESVKFFNEDKTLELKKSKFLVNFLRLVYKKYGKSLVFESLI